MGQPMAHNPLIPAKAGTQVFFVFLRFRHRCIGGLSAATEKAWVPAFAGMSGI
jgi:hypothetical protein